MASLFVWEASNLFVGDSGPDNSKHLTLAEIKIPTLEEMTQDHHAGGSIGQIKVGGMGIKALESTFKLKGWDPQVLSQFGLNSTNQLPFTCYGLIRDKNGNKPIEAKAVMKGRLVKIEADAHKRGDLAGHDYAISEVLHYELYFDKKEKYFWNFFTQDFRIDGVSQNQDERAILRIA